MTLVQRLHPYFSVIIEAATRRASGLFAEEVSLEHLLVAAIEDEETAANEVICHAFADPETVAMEALALAPGLMVVGSGGAVPFSPRSVNALHAVRERAAAAGWSEVDCAQLLRAAVEALPPEAVDALSVVGAKVGELAGSAGDTIVAGDGPLFRCYDIPAKRALSVASKLARSNRDASIGPARIALAALECDPELGKRCGTTLSRARIALGSHAVDTSPPPQVKPPLEARLTAFLEALPPGAGSLQLLEACHAPETQEIEALLNRHKVHPALLERAKGSFEDPTP
ncbi:MAG: hypothetical protein ACI841_000972 [Planctomycetota bacterium]|jgi:hypothetical protein